MSIGTASIRIRLAILIAIFFAAACSGPIGPFAGGALSGEPGPAEVDDWAFVEEVETAELETSPDDPRSVTIWFATIGERIYISSSLIHGSDQPSERGWIRAVQDDPRIRIRIDGVVYEREAIRVEGAAEVAAARTALETKYELDPAERDPERTIWVYRLDPRTR
jgi:hypothetical protein